MFKTEAQLVEAIENAAKQPGVAIGQFSSDFEVLKEVNLGHGIADIVLVDIKCNCMPVNYYLNEHDIAVLEFVTQQKKVTKKDILNFTRLNISSINRTIKALAKESYISVSKDYIISTNTYTQIINKTIAIEAKLRNWSRALKQAYRYKCFANYSFVCLPSIFSGPAIKNIKQFRETEVGLLTIDNVGTVSTIYLPPRICPFNSRMSLLLNELVKQTICSRSTNYSSS